MISIAERLIMVWTLDKNDQGLLVSRDLFWECLLLGGMGCDSCGWIELIAMTGCLKGPLWDLRWKPTARDSQVPTGLGLQLPPLRWYVPDPNHPLPLQRIQSWSASDEGRSVTVVASSIIDTANKVDVLVSNSACGSLHATSIFSVHNVVYNWLLEPEPPRCNVLEWISVRDQPLWTLI